MKSIDNHFAADLIDWYSRVKRDLPWRKTKNPYNVWLSEIILQQTRIDQGLPYYENFVTLFPTVRDLANASEQQVMKTWEGLGYYSRARNLHATSKYVTHELGEKFPESYEGLIRLKGVGPYTAAAIASICFDERVPVVDGNVFRFTARYFGVKKDISDQKNRKYFENVLKELIPEDFPGMFNQAMMEYGATVCKPGKPDCGSCLYTDSCFAYQNGLQLTLPVKKGKTRVKERHIAYLIFDTGKETLMRKRTSSIWTGLFEFHNLEQDQEISEKEIQGVVSQYSNMDMVEKSDPVKHLLSHRKLWVTFYRIPVKDNTLDQVADDLNLSKFSWQEVLTLPRAKVIVNHLQEADF